jgi:hypothetical protein
MGDQNLISQAPPCFGRHVNLLVPAAFAVVSTNSGFKVDVEIIVESFSQHDEKHVVLTTLSGIRIGKRHTYCTLNTPDLIQYMFNCKLTYHNKICYFKLYQSALGPRGGLWAFFLWVIQKEDLCPSSGDNNTLMMMMTSNCTLHSVSF